MSFAIKVEHHPEQSDRAMTYEAHMYEDGMIVPGTWAFGATPRAAREMCADRFEQRRNARPDEWVEYTPAG